MHRILTAIDDSMRRLVLVSEFSFTAKMIYRAETLCGYFCWYSSVFGKQTRVQTFGIESHGSQLTIYGLEPMRLLSFTDHLVVASNALPL